MAKILILYEDSVIRSHLSSILKEEGYKVVECDSVDSAEAKGTGIDLFICGQLGKYSDGLLFAAEKAMEGKRVLILADRRKFSRIPFMGIQLLTNREALLEEVETALAGDT
jgi:DNA-binding response OmpR family regulator